MAAWSDLVTFLLILYKDIYNRFKYNLSYQIITTRGEVDTIYLASKSSLNLFSPLPFSSLSFFLSFSFYLIFSCCNAKDTIPNNSSILLIHRMIREQGRKVNQWHAISIAVVPLLLSLETSENFLVFTFPIWNKYCHVINMRSDELINGRWRCVYE